MENYGKKPPGGIAYIVIVLLFLGSILLPLPIRAAPLSSIPSYIAIQNSSVVEGDIISFSPGGYLLSNIPYDPYIAGVINLHPAISFTTSGAKAYPMVTSGIVNVRVTSSNGAIAKGDLVTTSGTSGVGMKATQTGYVVGAALTSYTSINPHAIATIPVTLDVHYATVKGATGGVRGSLSDIVNLSQIATYEQPSTVIRYLLVALIIAMSFGAGFFIFDRTIMKSIDAIGRNPLASHLIQLGAGVNIFITLLVTLGGLYLAYLVLRL